MPQASRWNNISRWTVLLVNIRVAAKELPAYSGEKPCPDTDTHDPHAHGDWPGGIYVCVGRLQLWTPDEIEEYLNT